MIERPKYIEKIVPFIDKPLIKVIIGVRRSGKTVLLEQVRQLISSRVGDEQTLSINFDLLGNRGLLNYNALYDYVMEKSRALGGKRLYIFFDEIQEVENWQKAVNSLSVEIDCDIYLTGSNSNMLSGELATYIAGRYVHFTVYPFTFSEIKQYYRQTKPGAGFPMKFPVEFAPTDEQLFEQYLKYGGLPQRLMLDDGASVRAYLDDVFNTIVIKDVVSRNRFNDVDLLNRLTAFLLDNVGNPFSASSICRKLKAEGVSTTVSTLMNYIAALKNAFVIMTAPRYDLKGKALLQTFEKYYATDLGLRNNVKSSDVTDYSKLYENVVYLEMLSRGYEINVGKLNDTEIDFICVRGQRRIYIQVAYLLADNDVVEREFRPLKKIHDNFSKYVVSADKHDFSHEGIIHKNIIDFLLSEDY